jgi:hypothetical protein
VFLKSDVFCGSFDRYLDLARLYETDNGMSISEYSPKIPSSKLGSFGKSMTGLATQKSATVHQTQPQPEPSQPSLSDYRPYSKRHQQQHLSAPHPLLHHPKQSLSPSPINTTTKLSSQKWRPANGSPPPTPPASAPTSKTPTPLPPLPLS